MDLSRLFTSVSESDLFAVVVVIDFRPIFVDVFFDFPLANFRSFSESVSEISPSSKSPRYLFIKASVVAFDAKEEEEEGLDWLPFFELARPGMTASVEDEVVIAKEEEEDFVVDDAAAGTTTVFAMLFLEVTPFAVFAVPFLSAPLPPSLSDLAASCRPLCRRSFVRLLLLALDLAVLTALL